MKMLNIKTVLIVLAVSLSSTLIIMNFTFLKFEYYVWNLSSDSEQARESAADKIINMGDCVVPYLIQNLESKYIFESYYMVYCLEEITKAQTYDREHADFDNIIIPFWRKWWQQNRNKY